MSRIKGRLGLANHKNRESTRSGARLICKCGMLKVKYCTQQVQCILQTSVSNICPESESVPLPAIAIRMNLVVLGIIGQLLRVDIRLLPRLLPSLTRSAVQDSGGYLCRQYPFCRDVELLCELLRDLDLASCTAAEALCSVHEVVAGSGRDSRISPNSSDLAQKKSCSATTFAHLILDAQATACVLRPFPEVARL